MNNNLKILLSILAFIEGGAVMCVELCSAKILTPYFGTSIYIWAAVLGITLTALMSGYYLGGYLSTKYKEKTMVLWLMILGGVLVTIMPVVSDSILPTTINMSLIKGSILSLIGIMFFPLVLFGATSPMLINQFTSEAKESGKSSGTVYAISTLGGIITTFILGFYTLPELGITKTLYGYGLLILIYTITLFVLIKKFNITAALLLGISALSYNFTTDFSAEVIYHSDGILGELKVVDRVFYSPKEGRNIEYRSLMVNNISQTIMNKENPDVSYWDYVEVLTYNLNAFKNGNNTLLLGLGGGTLYKTLENNNYNVEVVELDGRIVEVAKKYFEIEDNINATIDDARHFLKTTDNSYDVIIYDLFHAETPPSHLMTKEAFTELKSNLNENGILVVNFFGFIEGETGKAARSLYRTLKAAEFDIRLIATPGQEYQRNLLFICGKNQIKAKQQIVNTMIYEMDLDLEDAVTLTDDKPSLEHLYLQAALTWRKDYNEFNTKYFIQNKQ